MKIEICFVNVPQDEHATNYCWSPAKSSSFLTPMSYQTNLMVLSPGGYRFTDYFKFGITLQLLMVITSVSCSLLFADYYNPSDQ